MNSDVKVNSVGELVALLKREPGKFNFGSIGNGSLSHLAMEAIALASGTKMVHVPYPSSPAAMTAIIRGDVQMGCLPAIAVTPHVASGAVKILARLDRETIALFARHSDAERGRHRRRSRRLDGHDRARANAGGRRCENSREVVEAIGTGAIRDKLAAQLMEPIGNTPAEFRARIDGEIVRWAPVIKAAGIKVN